MSRHTFATVFGLCFASVMLGSYIRFGYSAEAEWYTSWWRTLTLPAFVMSLVLIYLAMIFLGLGQIVLSLVVSIEEWASFALPEPLILLLILGMPLFIQGYAMGACGKFLWDWARSKHWKISGT